MSNMNKILVENLKPGMAFDRDVFIDKSTKLVDAKVPLTANDIKRLMTWGVLEVETAGSPLVGEMPSQKNEEIVEEKDIVENYKDLLKKRRTLIEVTKNAHKEVSDVYGAIKKDDTFAVDGIKKAVADIVSLVRANPSVFLFLYGLREDKDYLVSHAVNVTFYAVSIGISLKYSVEKLINLGIGTMLINSGMLKVPVYIIHKQSNLTEQEYNQIKTHPIHGYKSLRQLGDVNEEIAVVSLQHHEFFDGKGYPRGLRGDGISEFARIAAIADSYEAQVSNRSYKKRVFFYHAMKNLLSSGVSKFDPVILRIFLSQMSVYPIGSLVEINDSSIGIVIGSVPQKPMRPVVKIIIDSKGVKVDETRLLNLLQETSFYIAKALDENDAGLDIYDHL
jgi:HD-GYP domain-containing protein (c-di-GMP phosphodiesterase class II)